MARIAIVVLALAASLSGCAGLRSSTDDTGPSAAIPDRLEPLSGRWQGSISETAGWYWQGTRSVDLTIARDGSWQGTIGKSKAAGTVEFKGGDLVLRGTERTERGTEDPVYLRLRGDATRRWGETVTEFNERSERASVSLRKTS
jgi:hypothetical protein